MQGGGKSGCAVRTKEFSAVGSQTVDGFVGDQECNSRAEFSAVGVCGQQALQGRVILRDNMGHACGTGGAQHPLDILRGGDPASVGQGVLYLQTDNFDRVFRAGKKCQTLAQAVRVVLEDGITRAMGDAVRLVCAGGERRGSPYLAGFLIPQVKRFAGWITDRVVGPGSETVSAAVQCPGALAAGFADHKTKSRIANYIHPGGWSGPAGW